MNHESEPSHSLSSSRSAGPALHRAGPWPRLRIRMILWRCSGADLSTAELYMACTDGCRSASRLPRRAHATLASRVPSGASTRLEHLPTPFVGLRKACIEELGWTAHRVTRDGRAQRREAPLGHLDGLAWVWRNGWRSSGRERGIPPVAGPGTAEGLLRYLCEADRIHIGDRLRGRIEPHDHRGLGCSPSMVSREICRAPAGRGSRWRHRPHTQTRRPWPKLRKIGQSPELENASSNLSSCWTSEQIVQQLHWSFPDLPAMHVMHEAMTASATA